jgi:hypothetical protein
LLLLTGTLIVTQNFGDDIVSRIGLAVSAIVDDPELRADAEYGIRYWPVQRFPYVVMYDITDSEVLIVGAMHTSQDAEKFRKRRG